MLKFVQMFSVNRKLLAVIVITVLGAGAVVAQQTEFDRKNFVGKEQVFKQANASYNSGNRFFNEGDFLFAKAAYEKALMFNPNHAMLNYNLGICYLKTGEKYKAKDYFINAHRLDTGIHEAFNFFLGSCLQLESSWDSALICYDNYLESLKDVPFVNSERKMVEKRKQECKNGMLLSTKQHNVTIKNLGQHINTKFAEYTPYITTDESKIFFTSRREGTTGNTVDKHDGLYFEDIYMSSKVNEEWTAAVNAGSNINTKWHDAVCGIFPDGHTMIIFKGDVNDGDLFYVKYENGQWSRPLPFGDHINTAYHESSACLSSDGRNLYFVSNKPGGFGERDIYRSRWDAVKNEWGEAVNLGPEINTVFNEEGVFLHPDNKNLFFASNGLQSIGGYDIMKTEKVNDKWTQPINLGIPVNTPDDDVFVSVSANGKNIFFSSFRKDGFGEKDIYVATMEDADVKAPNMLILHGEVVDESTGAAIDAHIDLVDLSKNEKIGTYSNDKETGKYVIPLPGGTNYGTVVYADGYIFESENVEVNDTTSFAEIRRKSKLKKIETGMIARMNNIFFETGKATILPASANELDRVADLLTKDVKIKIEVQGHSDNVGDAEKNMLLSTQRAEAVYLELVKRNISAQRLSYQGYGESKPAATNDTEKGRSRNRRIEFWIMEDGN